MDEPTGRRRDRRCSKVVGTRTLLAAAATVFLMCPTRAAGAPLGDRFYLTARADTAVAEMIYSAAPLAPEGRVLFLSPATAQATFSSLGTTSAFAAAPYPGEFVASLPGTASGFSGGQLDLPNAPIIVTSDSRDEPTPLSTQDGPYELAASSSDDGSEANAEVGGATGGIVLAAGTATARTMWTDDGEYVAEAAAVVRSLELAPGIVLGEVHSEAQGRARAGGEPTFTTSFRVDGLTVAGTDVDLGADGLVLDEGGPLAGVGAPADVLAAAGITVEIVPSELTDSSATSAGVRITKPFDVPGQGPGTLVVDLGRVTVSTSAQPSAPSRPAIPAPPTAVQGDATQPLVPQAGPSAAGAPAPVAGAQPVAATPTETGVVATAGRPYGPVGRSFYVALAVMSGWCFLMTRPRTAWSLGRTMAARRP